MHPHISKMLRVQLAIGCAVGLAGCWSSASSVDDFEDGSITTDTGFDAGTDPGQDTESNGADLGPILCHPCIKESDCQTPGVCVQYAGSDYCAEPCAEGICQTNETCLNTSTGGGMPVSVCVPANGSCGSAGCGDCPKDTTCDLVAGLCVPNSDGGDESVWDEDGGLSDGDGSSGDPDAGFQDGDAGHADGDTHGTDDGQIDAGGDGGGSCGPYDPPDMASCCTACTPGVGNCQANGCYGGWWCNHSTCGCHTPPTDCGSDGGTDAGEDAGTDGGVDAGTDTGWDAGIDAGTDQGVDAGPDNGGDEGWPTGSVGPEGGSVSRLFFAVVGDTRPAAQNDTYYPSEIITPIYQQIEAMTPRPQFVIGTGDYMFVDEWGDQAPSQLQKYVNARNYYSGTMFPVPGNHECTTATASNCDGTNITGAFQAYLNALVNPLGKPNPYYAIPVIDLDGHWTAKFLFVACNAWDQTQRSWLQSQLAQSTTYTFVINHEPFNTTAPCDSDLQSALSSAAYNLLIVGHTHSFSHSGRQMIEGLGGAPRSGSYNYGYATIEQLSTGGFRINQYDYQTQTVVHTYTIN